MSSERHSILHDSSSYTPIRPSSSSSPSLRLRLAPAPTVVAAVSMTLAAVLLFSFLSHSKQDNLDPVAGVKTVAKPRFPPAIGHIKDCMSPNFVQETLVSVHELSFFRAFEKFGYSQDKGGDALDLAKFEASDVAGSPDGKYYTIVYDNSFYIGRVKKDLSPIDTGNASNTLIQWPGDTGEDSQFEAITFNETSESYLVFQETNIHNEGTKKAVLSAKVFNIHIGKNHMVTIIEHCHVDYVFSHENKGIEGAAIIYTESKDASYLLALCEGNHCSGGKKGKMSGNGRILRLEKDVDDQGECSYKVKQIINIPSVANFQDYSAISIYDNKKVAISSQENAAVWIGYLEMDDNHDVTLTKGKVYDFPRNDECEIKYCNIEGVYFQEANILVAVSDQMKKGGRQPFICREKDQAIHTFVIP